MNDEIYEIKQIAYYNALIDQTEKEVKEKTFTFGLNCLTAALNLIIVALNSSVQLKVIWAIVFVLNSLNAYLNGKMVLYLKNEKKDLEKQRDSYLEEKTYELTRK